MKNVTATLLALALVLVGKVLGDPAASQEASVVAGQSLAGIALGPNGIEELKKLGMPYRVDRGRSQTRQVWKWFKPGGRFDTFFAHTVNNGAIDAQPPDGVTIAISLPPFTGFVQG
jgi:2-polyprenyl-6-methoxyphenol hydroxylase-like FAD-dependent oxidoreductase